MTSISKYQTVSNTRSLLASLTVVSQNLLGRFAPDDDETDNDKTDMFKLWSPSSSTIDILSLISISYDEDLQHRLRILCVGYKDLFSNE